jgi:hypothetical protein
VRVNKSLRFREPTAVDKAGVVLGIAEDGILFVNKCRNNARVGSEAR